MNWRAIGAFAIGALAIAAGVYLLVSETGNVMCGAHPMSQDEICEYTSRGITRTYNFEEMSESQSRNPYYAIGFGVLAILYGGFTVWGAKNKKPARAAT